jgi:hypothetical protein
VQSLPPSVCLSVLNELLSPLHPALPQTCVPQYHACGWPSEQQQPLHPDSLPLLVVAVGAEGSGHHTWSQLLDGVVDCILVGICCAVLCWLPVL